MITEPIALDKSLNTTDQNPKNLADVVQKGLNDIKNAIGGGGGGGGHTIVDSDGQDMPQEDAMQFADAFVSDDDVNGRTVVENVKEVTLAELSQATERGMYLATDEESVPIGASSEDKVEVVADGVKTYATLLNELYALIDKTKITPQSILVYNNEEFFNLLWFNNSEISLGGNGGMTGSYLVNNSVCLKASGSTSERFLTNSNGTTTYSTFSANKPTNGYKIVFYYGTSSTVINLKTSADYCQYDEDNTIKDVLTTIDTLFDGTLTAGNSTSLSKSIANYRQIVIEFAIAEDISGTGATQMPIVNPRLNIPYVMSVALYINPTLYNNVAAVKFTDNTHISFANAYKNGWSHDSVIKRVYGLH